MAWYFYVAAILPLIVLLMGEKKESVLWILISKPLLSLLFLSTAVLSPVLSQSYARIILIGLSLSFVGDICLVFFFNKRIFTLGLGTFLAGHLAYAFAFFSHGTLSWILIPAVALVCIGGIVAYRWLKPHLGDMTKAVIAYISIISVMLLGAFSLIAGNPGKPIHRIILFGAALIFYISDLFVARHRFIKKQWSNRVVGLPLYFTAQMAIALSCGWIV